MNENHKFRARATFWRAFVASLPWLWRQMKDKWGGKTLAVREGVRISAGASIFMFRRNIHRLEKGLTMPSRRSLFGEKYIGQVVHDYERLLASRGDCDSTLRWGEQVLDQYFSVCAQHEAVEEAREKYRRLRPSVGRSATPPAPWSSEADRAQIHVTANDLAQLLRRRKSIRQFQHKPVPRDLMDRAAALASQAPTPCNRQSYFFHCISCPSLIRDIVRMAGGISGYHIPALVAVTVQYRAFADERDVDTAIVDASFAAMCFLLALETVGLSSVVVNWPRSTKTDRAIVRLLELEPDEVVVMCIGVGFADPKGYVLASGRRMTSEWVTWTGEQSDEEHGGEG